MKVASGAEIEADIIVSATGLDLQFFGGVDIQVDNKAVLAKDTMTYKGMMFSGVPNFALSSGYTNASWTLKCDLTSAYVCRLLNHMDKKGYTQAGLNLTGRTWKLRRCLISPPAMWCANSMNCQSRAP